MTFMQGPGLLLLAPLIACFFLGGGGLSLALAHNDVVSPWNARLQGTMFLDEVGEIPLELQPKLLRVLQEQEFERLGNTQTQRVDVRLIAATNRDLAQMAVENRYRSDLFYRLNVFPITIPPLRERPEDIPVLARFFANKFAGRMKKQIETIPAEAVAALQRYHWPGNIRELENMIERAVILTQGAELQIPLPEINVPAKTAVAVATSVPAPAPPSSSDSASLEAIEREHILRVLAETDWVVGGPNGAATRLRMKRTTLQARMPQARHCAPAIMPTFRQVPTCRHQILRHSPSPATARINTNLIFPLT